MHFLAASRFRSCLLRLTLLVFSLASAGYRSGASSLQSAPATAQESAAPASASSTQNSTATYRLSPEKYQKAVAYSRAGYRLYFLSVFWNLAVILLLLRSGFIAKLRDFAEPPPGTAGYSPDLADRLCRTPSPCKDGEVSSMADMTHPPPGPAVGAIGADMSAGHAWWPTWNSEVLA